MLATQLTAARLAAFGYLPNYGVEAFFLNRRENRSVHELESIEQQLALLGSVAIPDQVEMLVGTLRDMAELEPLVAQLVRAWFLGDDDEMLGLFEQFTAGSNADQAFLESVLYERNATMAQDIKDLIGKDGNWLVLVGAGHLPGPRGIVALLEAQGITGQRIMSGGTTRKEPSESNGTGES